MTVEIMNVAECKNCKKSIVTKALVLLVLLAILFKSNIGIGIGNTWCQSTVIGIDNSFQKYC